MDRCKVGWLATTLMLATVSAGAEPFRDKPLRLLVPYTPGGAADVVSQAVTQHHESAHDSFIHNISPVLTGARSTL